MVFTHNKKLQFGLIFYSLEKSIEEMIVKWSNKFD